LQILRRKNTFTRCIVANVYAENASSVRITESVLKMVVHGAPVTRRISRTVIRVRRTIARHIATAIIIERGTASWTADSGLRSHPAPPATDCGWHSYPAPRIMEWAWIYTMKRAMRVVPTTRRCQDWLRQDENCTGRQHKRGKGGACHVGLRLCIDLSERGEAVSSSTSALRIHKMLINRCPRCLLNGVRYSTPSSRIRRMVNSGLRERCDRLPAEALKLAFPGKHNCLLFPVYVHRFSYYCWPQQAKAYCEPQKRSR
jgi:hypothetical protein